MAEDFAAHGLDALERLRHLDPAAYLKIVASLIPRELVLQREQEYAYGDLSYEEVGELLDRAQRSKSVTEALDTFRPKLSR